MPSRIRFPTALFGVALAINASTSEAADESPPAEASETIVVKSENLSVETLIDRKVYRVSSDAQSSLRSVAPTVRSPGPPPPPAIER